MRGMEGLYRYLAGAGRRAPKPVAASTSITSTAVTAARAPEGLISDSRVQSFVSSVRY